jgi:hypothetical protein
MGIPIDDEEELLRSVAIQNAQSILLARNRAEQDLVAAKEALEVRTAQLERANALIRTIAENAASCLLMLDERKSWRRRFFVCIRIRIDRCDSLTYLPLHTFAIAHVRRTR